MSSTAASDIQRFADRIAQRQQQLAEERSHLSRIGEEFVIAEWMFRRAPRTVSRDRDALVHVCEVCGVVEPRQCKNGYIRRECRCEQLDREAGRSGMRLSEMQDVARRLKAAKTYTWLGVGLDPRYSRDVEDCELENKTFATFDPSAQTNVAAFKQHLFVAKSYASQIVASHTGQTVRLDNLLLAGGYGTGKTHLAAAILNTLRDNDIACRFCTAQDLFNSLYAATFQQKLDLLAQASTTPLLVIDDLDKLHLGKETDGAFQRQTLFDILDKRYKRHVPTIITTNETQDLSPWLNGATISRLYEHITLLAMVGRDYRRGGAK